MRLIQVKRLELRGNLLLLVRVELADDFIPGRERSVRGVPFEDDHWGAGPW